MKVHVKKCFIYELTLRTASPKILLFLFFPHSINKEWENRWSAKLGKTKSLRKKNKPADDHIDNHVWKGKQLQGPPPRFAVSDHLGRPEGQRRGFSTPNSSYNDKKGYNNLNRLQLLNFITQTQPSSTMWGKSWKYNKSLPLLEEGSAATEWGKCWMFATWQPYSETGKPWLNGPNIIDPQSLHLWKKPAYREVESQGLDVSPSTEEWKMSWRKSDKNHKEEGLSIKEENVPQSGLFPFLVETQHNETSLEWSNSWKVIKPTSEIPNGAKHNETISHKQHNDGEMSSKWDDSWRLVNHHSCNKSTSSQVQKSHSLEWSDSWRVAMVDPNNPRISDCSLTQDHSYTNNGHYQQEKSQLHKVLFESQKLRFRDKYLQLCDKFMALSEWDKSWQVTKNNSKPSEEIEKVLKVSLSRMETTMERVKDANKHHLATDTTELSYEKLKHDVVYHPERELTKNNFLHLKQHENASSASEWTDSWKTVRHRRRMERRRMMLDPLRSFRSSENGAGMKPSVSEWKDSWKFHCQPLYQETERWQQGWSTRPQMRLDRGMSQNHFMPVEHPKNGPTGEHRWEDSWRFLRPQHRPGPRDCRTQSSPVRSGEASHHPSDSLPQSSVRQRGYACSVDDWQKAWMVSDTQSPLDNPSLTQWRESWKWSFNTENGTEQLTRVNEVDVLMEIQPGRENVSLQEVELFDNQMFRERYPEKQWSTSWRAEPLLNHQHSNCRSSEIPGEMISRTTQQQCVTAKEHGSKWGISFRLANPMPHMEQPWVKSTPNPCHYTVLWSREKKMQSNINTAFSNNHATFKLWGNSHQFLQGVRPQIKDKTKSTEPVDPCVIITNKTKNKRYMYMEKEKQSQRKWAGCHLLGKTQPRPKKGPAAVKKHNLDDDKFLEEWEESWRYLIDHDFLKMKMAVKSLSEWKKSWKFLLSPYQPMNSPKTK